MVPKNIKVSTRFKDKLIVATILKSFNSNQNHLMLTMQRNLVPNSSLFQAASDEWSDLN